MAALAAVCLLACPRAPADVDIEIRGVDDELRRNVLAYLSFERYRDSDDLSVDTLERLHNRIEREVRSALRPFGYYEPSVRSDIDGQGNGDWVVTIDIDPGRPIILERVEVRVLGPGATDPLFRRITSNLPLKEGTRLNHGLYEQVKGDLQRTASTYGYLDARLTRNELRVDPRNFTATVALEMQTGARYRFGTTTIEQNSIDESLVRRYVRYEEGAPFDMTELLRTQFALDDSQYFSTVEVLPGDPDRNALVVPVSIRAEPNRRHRYSFGAGYGTDTEIRGTATWEDRRINRRGHRFNTALEAAADAWSLVSRYSIPIGDPALEKLAFDFTLERRELADIDTENIAFEPSITQVRGRWQSVLFVTATRALTEVGDERSVDRLLIPGISIATVPQGYLGEPLFARGLYAELRGSHGIFGSDSDFLQARVQAERAFKIAERWHLLLRGEIGASLVAQFSQLPGSVRFFAGGDRSVRGFGYNELSPTEEVCLRAEDAGPEDECVPQTIRVGGKHLLTGTVELIRELPRSLGVAAFFDFGNAFDRFGDPLEYSVGLGMRWRLPVVTLGIDIAQPLSEPGMGPRLHINFSPKL